MAEDDPQGPPPESRSSPGDVLTTSLVTQSREIARHPLLGQTLGSSQVRVGSGGGPQERAALCAAHCSCRCDSLGRKAWRERPRCARFQWPHACPEGSLTPSPSVSLSLWVRAGFRIPAATIICAGEIWPGSWLTSSGRSGLESCGKSESLKSTRSAFDCAADCCVSAARDCCPFRRSLRGNGHYWDGSADHHAFDARSVLGTVQGSSLRSARANARPAGLDGACAQIRSLQLRDGRWVMMRSWTDLGR